MPFNNNNKLTTRLDDILADQERAQVKKTFRTANALTINLHRLYRRHTAFTMRITIYAKRRFQSMLGHTQIIGTATRCNKCNSIDYGYRLACPKGCDIELVADALAGKEKMSHIEYGVFKGGNANHTLDFLSSVDLSLLLAKGAKFYSMEGIKIKPIHAKTFMDLE
jgi:hypothetical protein